ncbi:MAG: 3-oxoacyl-ACP reductase FabG [Planctomycetes bacterium]|nr:3-oxoacyl-ACP reductase FabG [Planctomycetota bacterium]
MSFEGQTAVVTGGTRGLGRAVSLDLAAQGCRVIAIYKSDEAAARSLLTENARFDGRLSTEKVDVADYDAVRAFWERAETGVQGGVQILVHASGIRRDRVVAMMSREEWREVLSTNLDGTFHMAKYATLHMLSRRYGRIVLVTSPAREHGFEGQGNYSASKAGQVGLARSLARETASRGITVNCVSPGFIDTELLADLDPETRKKHVASVPLKRFGRAEEVAFAVRMLVSREASYVTGSVLDVSGGL